MKADVLSIDLPWTESPGKWAAVAWRALDSIQVESYPFERGALAGRLAGIALPDALVLLDIPIMGTRGLGPSSPFRSVDHRLQGLGIPLLPSWHAEDRGTLLAAELRALGLRVEESYPYAVLRVIHAMRNARLPLRFDADTYARANLFTDSWWSWPPKYKRARTAAERRSEMSKVLSLIRKLGPPWAAAARSPDDLRGAELRRLADEYDALIGLVAGVATAERSPWSFRAEVAGTEGAILMLADRSIRTRFETG